MSGTMGIQGDALAGKRANSSKSSLSRMTFSGKKTWIAAWNVS